MQLVSVGIQRADAQPGLGNLAQVGQALRFAVQQGVKVQVRGLGPIARRQFDGTQTQIGGNAQDLVEASR